MRTFLLAALTGQWVALRVEAATAYRVARSYTPPRLHGDHNCNGCAHGSSGPCKHTQVDICFPYLPGTTKCDTGLFECSTSGSSTCKDCVGGTDGPCKHLDSGLCLPRAGKVEHECEAGLVDCAWMGELSLTKGDFVAVPSHQRLDDRWYAVTSSKGERGLFPSAHLVLGHITDDEEERLMASSDREFDPFGPIKIPGEADRIEAAVAEAIKDSETTMVTKVGIFMGGVIFGVMVLLVGRPQSGPQQRLHSP